ncbi:hypothetical protein BCV70DRAFT_197834 [Testicularia cyperi]|uniref:CAP-Gly domain-containing protein n=1 Tax=Testicularia cyperi TaxID=1882483 RepID=A0A317XZE8_9BASI|nr:hypothetical protein BCV70DRAFT_197834 [Testicularia cyperi]
MSTPRSAAAASQPLQLHARVSISNLGHGEVLFVGQTSFAPGVWVGIELDVQNGKNNGSVQGKRYFECEDGFGVFVRPSQVHVLAPGEEMHDVYDDPEPEPEPEPEPRPRPTATRAARQSTAPSAPSATAASRLSPRKSVVTPARSATARPSLGTDRRTSNQSASSSVSSTAASSRPGSTMGSSAATVRRVASPSKPVATRSPTKLGTTATTPSTHRLGASALAGGTARSTVSRPGITSRTSATSPTTPLASARVQRPGLSSAASATRTPAVASVTRPSARTVPSSSTLASQTKPQTPAAARAGLRPVGRPSMTPVGARTATSSPSVSASSRLAAARSGGTSAPISRAGSVAGASTIPPRAGSSLAPASTRSGPRSSGGSAVSSGRNSTSQRLMDADFDEEDRHLDADPADEAEDEDLIGGGLSLDRHMPEDLLDDDEETDVADAADVTISAPGAIPASASETGGLRATKLLNKSTRDFMSLVEPSPNAQARSSAEFGALQKEAEELRAKVRVLEKKRDDERTRIAELEKLKESAEMAIAANPKLTARIQDLQAELKDQKKLEKDWAMQRDDFERQISRLNDELESITLDREMAEERAETAILEAEEHRMVLETANAKLAALQKDAEPLTRVRRISGGGEGVEGDGDDDMMDEDDSPAYALLQSENDQLRRVLRDLRDRSNEIEGDQRRKIIELERENAELIELNSTNDSLLPELENAESMIEDLKLQLDDALGAQDLVEQLTERNLQLSDLVQKLRNEIEEHETIAEINNELEEQHTINEKELHEEVDLAEARIRDLQIRNEELENSAADYQNTFGQFRELVANLQAELETARAEQAELGTDGTGRKDLADQAMLNLNLKLQSTALKRQAKTLDLELGKLQAVQATSHLDMVRAYLPQAYFEADADAVHCLLFFRRMAIKSDLIKSVVETNHDIQEALSGVVPETLVDVCQMRHSIAHFSALSRQIAAVLQLAPADIFLRGGRMWRENMAIERKVDAFIEALRREELKELECGAEFGRFVKQFEDFSMALGGDENDSDLAAKEVGSANLIDHDLDTLIAALGYAKQQIAQLYADDDVEWELAGHNIEEDVFDPLQELINRIRGTKVPTRKVLRRLLSLAENEEAVRMEAIMNLPPLGRLTSQLVTFATKLCKSTTAYVGEVRSSKMPFQIGKLIDFVHEATEEGLGKAEASLWSGPLESAAHLSTTIQGVLAAIVEQQHVIRISGLGPWLSRAEEIKVQATRNPELERQVVKLSEDARDLLRQVKARDQALQEGAIKIERLQKQLEKSKAQVDQNSEVRATLVEVQKQAKAYEEANDALQSELEALQRDNDRLKQQVSATEAGGVTGSKDATGAGIVGGLAAGGAMAGAAAGALVGGSMDSAAEHLGLAYSSLETSYLVDQLEALKGALRHLRQENAYLKGQDLLQKLRALPSLGATQRHRSAAAVAAPIDARLGTLASSGDESDTKQVGQPAVKKASSASSGQQAKIKSISMSSTSGSVEAEAKRLCSAALATLALPQMVDLTPVIKQVVKKSSESLKESDVEKQPARLQRAWIPYHKQPAVQLQHQQARHQTLALQLARLQDRLPLHLHPNNSNSSRAVQQHAPGLSSLASALPRVVDVAR